MSNVVLSIGGRSFTVACADGEEARIGSLGRMIDAKVSALGDGAAQNETRMLLFAALVLADELDEAQAGRTGHPVATAVSDANPAITAEKLDRIADKLENLADLLEQSDASA